MPWLSLAGRPESRLRKHAKAPGRGSFWYSGAMRRILLIGGMPTAGKSTIAANLSQRLGLPWISTDQVRTIMRSVADRQTYPELFSPTDDGEVFLSSYSPQQIADMEYEQGIAAWRGISQLIRQDFTWRQGFVMEGVNILPHLVAQDFAQNEAIKAVFIGDHDKSRIREVVFTRGLWGAADSYPNHLKEKEVEWVLRFSRKIHSEAVRYGLPWVEVNKHADDVKEVLRALKMQV